MHVVSTVSRPREIVHIGGPRSRVKCCPLCDSSGPTPGGTRMQMRTFENMSESLMQVPGSSLVCT